jgi:basic amino acid/polyamine antiporter, APA family
VNQAGSLAAIISPARKSVQSETRDADSGVLWPRISETRYLIGPVHVSSTYAFSLSTVQLIGVLLIGLLTWSNACGLQYGKMIRNVFTSTKIGSLIGVICLGLSLRWNAVAVKANFVHMWSPRGYAPVAPGLTPETVFGLFVAISAAQVGSLFAADAWNNITFTRRGGEVSPAQRPALPGPGHVDRDRSVRLRQPCLCRGIALSSGAAGAF